MSVKAGPPAVALVGEIELIAGTGLLMVNVCAFDVPPPGAAFTTVTEAVPPVLMSDEGTVAVTLVLVTKVVVKVELFQCTTEPETKFDPLTVSVKEAPPAVALVGEIEVVAGNGLLTVNVLGDDVPPPGPGFVTVTLILPAVAMSVDEIAAVNVVLLENVVVRGAPFQFTTELLMNPEPFTVSVKAAPPAVALVGKMEVTAGFGLLIVKVSEFDAPPPGPGFVTMTGTVPALARSPVRIWAVTFTLLTKVVTRAELFQLTVAPFTKFEPFNVSVKPAEPTGLLLGESEVSTGTGLGVGVGV